LAKEFKESIEKGGEEICPICRIRLKDENKDRCGKCEKRYEERAKNWLKSDAKETIWLDEVSDKNDRVALIVGQFELRKWLNGEFIGTFQAQTFDEWKKENKNLYQRMSLNSLNDLENQFENLFNSSSLNNDQKELLESFIGFKPNNFINDFWAPITERDATGKAGILTDNSEKAVYLTKLLFRKHPSLARIYRIWSTTQEFINFTIFENILNKYSYGTDSPFKELRTKRIQFNIDPDPSIPIGATCDIDIDGVRLSPVCIDENQGIFVTTVDLQILSNKGKTVDEIALWMDGKAIKIKKEDSNKWQGGLRISSAKPAEPKFQNYLPYVKIYDYPDQFMVLVPAYDALNIAKKILEEYEIQFSKVRDRLPFHLGIIGFHRRTTLYVAMDAGKRLIDAFKRKSKTIRARVDSIADVQPSKLGKYVKKLTLQPDPCYSPVPLICNISYSTGDLNQEDEWHPYIRISDGNPNRGNYSFDYTGNGNYVVHVKELRVNDCIEIEPSYFKMVYLESAADRFRIDENLRALDDIERLDDLWNDIQNILKTKNLGISQLYAFWQEVEKRRIDYKGDSVWEDFVKSALINILKLSPQKDTELFNKLFQATKDSLLNICLHWNLQVRKTKPEKQEVEI